MTRRAYMDLDHGQLHYRIAGSGGLPLVCLHMSPYSGTMYEPLMAELATDRLVIAPDTPGYGMSDRMPEKPSIADYADVMVSCIDGLGLQQVDLLGFHTGTFIGAEMAARRPDLVRKLVLPGIPVINPDRREGMKAFYSKPRPYFEDENYLQERWSKGLAGRGGQSDARFLEQFADSLKAGIDTANLGFEAVFGYDPEAQLPKVSQPVLIPLPDEALHDNSLRAASLFPDARTEDWPDLKSDLFDCDADFIAARLRVFLDGEDI